MKMKAVGLVVVALLMIGFASSAAACESCVSAGYNGWVKCESGTSSGSQSCSGGFGVGCSLSGSCTADGGGGKKPLPVPTPVSVSPIVTPCLTCTFEMPAEGFMLRTAPETSASAELP
jgi:hypothetical protein